MNADYQRLRQQADHLFHRFNDVVDDRAAAGSIAGNIRNVVEDFEMNKNPHSIEDRVKRVVEDLKGLRHGDGATMDFGDVDELIDSYEDLREDIRDLDNY